MKTLEIAVQGERVIRVDGRDYSVTFPLPVVVDLEKELKRSMRQPVDFFRMTVDEVPAILKAALKTRHKDYKTVSMAILTGIETNAESMSSLMDFLCAAAFPRAMERVDAHIKKVKADGEQALKNVQSVAAFLKMRHAIGQTFGQSANATA